MLTGDELGEVGQQISRREDPRCQRLGDVSGDCRIVIGVDEDDACRTTSSSASRISLNPPIKSTTSGFTNAPRTIGSVAPVTHEITSAPATAASRSVTTSTVNPYSDLLGHYRSLGGITAPDLHRVEVTHVCVRLIAIGANAPVPTSSREAPVRETFRGDGGRSSRSAGRQRVGLQAPTSEPHAVEQQHAGLHHRRPCSPFSEKR